MVQHQSRHVVGRGGQGSAPHLPTGDAQIYQVSLPIILVVIQLPVEGCPRGATDHTNIQVHFAYHHVGDTIVILEEANRPYPQCPKCDMVIVQQDINIRHPSTDLCRWVKERKYRRLAAYEAEAGAEMALTIYGLHLEAVPYFKYPVWVLLELNNDWPEVVHNPRKARSKWSQLSRLLGRGGQIIRRRGCFI